MVSILVWCVGYFTLYFGFYTGFAQEIKQIKFTVSYSFSEGYKCNGVAPDLKVGEQFKVYVFGYYVEVKRCQKSLTSQDLVETAFTENYYQGYEYNSKHSIKVTQPGEWNYECMFYYYQCSLEGNKCYYKWWGKRYEATGFYCSIKLDVKDVVKPNGYLLVNNMNFTASGEKNVYKFRDREASNFTCCKTAGDSVRLTHTKDGKKNSTSDEKAAVSMRMELKTADNDSTLDCIVTSEAKSETIVKLRLIVYEESEVQHARGHLNLNIEKHDKVSVTIWIITFIALSIAFIIAVVIMIALRHNHRKQGLKNNSSTVRFNNLSEPSQDPTGASECNQPDECTYAAPYALCNLYTKQPTNAQDASKENTYQNTHQQHEEPTYASVQNIEPAYVSVHNGEPSDSSADNNEPSYAAVHKNEPKFSSTTQSAQNLKNNASINYINQKLIEYKKIKNIKEQEKLKNKKDQSSKAKIKRLESPTSNKVVYADLCLQNTRSGNFVAPKMPIYSEVKNLHTENDDYENVLMNDEIEPAYCEIIPISE